MGPTSASCGGFQLIIAVISVTDQVSAMIPLQKFCGMIPVLCRLIFNANQGLKSRAHKAAAMRPKICKNRPVRERTVEAV